MLARFRPKKWQHCVREKLLMPLSEPVITTDAVMSCLRPCCLPSHLLLGVSPRPAVAQRPKQATQQARGGSRRLCPAVSWDAAIHHRTFSAQRDPPVGEWRGIYTVRKNKQIFYSCTKKATALVAKIKNKNYTKMPKKTDLNSWHCTAPLFPHTPKFCICVLWRKPENKLLSPTMFAHFQILIYWYFFKDCTKQTARCVTFTCPLLNMTKEAKVIVRSRLWNSTMLEVSTVAYYALTHAVNGSLDMHCVFFLFQFMRNKHLQKKKQ